MIISIESHPNNILFLHIHIQGFFDPKKFWIVILVDYKLQICSENFIFQCEESDELTQYSWDLGQTFDDDGC